MTDQVTTKVCSNCKVEKLVVLFYKDKSAKDGLAYICKDCAKMRSKEWARANPEKVNAPKAKWKKNNPERNKAINKAWAKNNPDKTRAYVKAYTARCNDNYIAARIGLKLCQCPQELIELKRINLLITREIRNQQCQN